MDWFGGGWCGGSLSHLIIYSIRHLLTAYNIVGAVLGARCWATNMNKTCPCSQVSDFLVL